MPDSVNTTNRIHLNAHMSKMCIFRALFLIFLCASLMPFNMGYASLPRSIKYRRTNNFRICGALDEGVLDIVKIKGRVLRTFVPFLGFYALMLAPIYGIGIGPFGSITDFSTLRNRGAATTVANEYIVAPSGFTPARTNEESKEYSLSADDLERVVDGIVKQEPRVVSIAADPNTRRREYIQRTPIFRFPDVITFQYLPIDSDHSTLAVHSYSVYGESDFGVNKNRVRSWLQKVDNSIEKLN